MCRKSSKFINLWICLFLFCGFTVAEERELVVDNASLFGGNIDGVKNEAEKLVNLGADVHIWTIQSIDDSSTLDDYVRKMTLQYPSWMGNRPNDEYNFKSNLLLLIISKAERKTGIYYGSEWLSALDSQKTRIQSDYMNPKFKQGKFADGFAAGLHEINRVIDDYMHPSNSGSSTAPVIIVQPSQAPSQPTDFSGLWSVLAWAVGLGFLCFVGFISISIYSKSAKRKEEERQAQQSAKIAKQDASKSISLISKTLNDFKPIAVAAAKALDESGKNEIIKDLDNIENEVGIACQNYSSSDMIAGNPNDDGWTTAEYKATEENIRKNISSHLEEANRRLTKLKQKITDVRTIVQNADSKISEATEVINHSQAEIKSVSEAGYITKEMDNELVDAKSFLEKANASKEGKSYYEMINFCDNAIATARSAAEKAKLIPDIETSLKERIVSFEIRIDHLKEIIENGRTIFHTMKDQYLNELWESVKGNGSEAEKRIESSKVFLKNAKLAVALDKQEWSECDNLVTSGNLLLQEAESLIDSIVSLKRNIENATAEVVQEIDDANSDISKAWNYIKKFDADIDKSLEGDLKISEQKLLQCKEELSKSMPNYIKALKLAREANSNADRVFDKSVNQHEVAERQRKQAESLFKEAERSIETASNYIQSHRSDVDQSAKTKLSSAKSKLDQIKQSSGILAYIACATEADKLAENAYEMAKKDVRDAEYKRREDEREQERANNVILAAAALALSNSNSDDYSSSRRSSGGGSSSSWDSDSFSGGGSSSWGSDSGGSGGSTGW